MSNEVINTVQVQPAREGVFSRTDNLSETPPIGHPIFPNIGRLNAYPCGLL